MRKILIGICMLFLGCIIIYFNDGFKIMDEVVKSEDVLPIQNIVVEDFFGSIEIKKLRRVSEYLSYKETLKGGKKAEEKVRKSHLK